MLSTYLIPDPCFSRAAKAQSDEVYLLAKASTPKLEGRQRERGIRGQLSPVPLYWFCNSYCLVHFCIQSPYLMQVCQPRAQVHAFLVLRFVV